MIVFPLDCWLCFQWWRFPLGPLPFQPRVATMLHVVLVPSLSSPIQPWVDSHAPFGLVKFDVNEKLNENIVLECISKQCTCKGASKFKCNTFIYYHFSTLL
jgi:hypothetical protein